MHTQIHRNPRQTEAEFIQRGEKRKIVKRRGVGKRVNMRTTELHF